MTTELDTRARELMLGQILMQRLALRTMYASIQPLIEAAEGRSRGDLDGSLAEALRAELSRLSASGAIAEGAAFELDRLTRRVADGAMPPLA